MAAEGPTAEGPASSEATPLLAEFERPAREAWHAEVARLLKGRSFAKLLLTPTPEEITLQPIYTAADTAELPHLGSPPGSPPYVRGTRPAGSRKPAWEVAQELPYPSVAEFNQALRRGLERGQTAVNLLLDEAGRAGCDPGDAPAGSVGLRGTSIATLDDLDAALAGVDLAGVPILVDAGPSALPIAALLLALARRRKIALGQLRGSVGGDPLAHLVAGGTLPRPLARVYDETAALIVWTRVHAPGLRAAAADGCVYHNGGASAVEELAFTLAAGVEQLRAGIERGLTVEQIAPAICFRFSVGRQFFMEIAKLRAARLTWAEIVRASGGSESAQAMVIHARTARRSQTRLDPHVNILRATTEALAAIVGGSDSLHVSPFDEPLGLPSDLARRLARNTHTILRAECHFDAVCDPAGGSWFIDALTDQVARQAWKLFQKVEARGGLVGKLRPEWGV